MYYQLSGCCCTECSRQCPSSRIPRPYPCLLLTLGGPFQPGSNTSLALVGVGVLTSVTDPTITGRQLCHDRERRRRRSCSGTNGGRAAKAEIILRGPAALKAALRPKKGGRSSCFRETSLNVYKESFFSESSCSGIDQ